MFHLVKRFSFFKKHTVRIHFVIIIIVIRNSLKKADPTITAVVFQKESMINEPFFSDSA
jgi:hypothetical protein